MLKRTMAVAWFNEIANLPSVRPWLGHPDLGVLDLKGWVENASNICLIGPEGGFIGVSLNDGRYDVHSLFAPDHQGTIEAMREAARYFFLETECTELVTQVPISNVAALGLTKLAGFQFAFERPDAFVNAEGIPEVMRYWSLPLARWILRGEMIPEGQSFHEQLERAKAATGSPLAVHADDPAHNAMVGAVVQMARHGQVVKGIRTYNQWARVAGYQECVVLSEAPPIVDIHDAMVSLHRGEIEVLLCR